MLGDTDFLVIGSGLAGLNAALRLAAHGRVTVITKRQLSDSNTAFAQGGIAAVVAQDDTLEAHVADTLQAGAGLCREDVVRAVVADGRKAIARLVELGVRFDVQNGAYDLGREGGHSARRILHAKDLTGREICRALVDAVQQHDNITLLADHIAVDLITLRKLGRGREDRCVGAYVLNTREQRVDTLRAKATLLATGGAGKVYLYTSNPDVATGDGVAMAFRAGARIANMEFFQFHPTVLFHPHAKSFLVSEALRGEGGVLRRRDGSRLMQGVHPLEDLAPRDIVARAIDQDLKRTGEDYVTLDMTAKDPAFLLARFPNIHTACLALGIDMTKVPIPVVPAAHYMCGGVVTDLAGATDLPGLYAAGETACTGLHGANRLASNSLLEAAVFSDRAAAAMAAGVRETEAALALPEWDPGRAADPDEMVVVSHNWDELRRTMWNYVGIVRSDRRLERAMARIELLREEIDDYYWNFKLTHDLVELRNLVTVAHLIVASARARRESRGLHYNTATPELSHKPPHDTVIRRGTRGALQLAEPDSTS
ncbi:MAG: L-aspartate oxidase [Deltaproteobacteria bacterium]|nr:L-aspartate oxidase [Deltaproteobacteria bacterium]